MSENDDNQIPIKKPTNPADFQIPAGLDSQKSYVLNCKKTLTQSWLDVAKVMPHKVLIPASIRLKL